MEKEKLNYFAGFFDGEGCVSFSATKKNGKKYFSLKIAVVQTNPKPLQMLKESFGGSIYRREYKDYKVQGVWQIKGVKAIEFLKAVLPYLVVKRKQAELAIEYQALPWRRKRREKEQFRVDEKIIEKIKVDKHVNHFVN